MDTLVLRRTKMETHRWNIFRQCGRVGPVEEGRALILDVVDLDEDVGRRAEGLLGVGRVVSGLDHHVVGRPEVKVELASKLVLLDSCCKKSIEHISLSLDILFGSFVLLSSPFYYRSVLNQAS